MAGQRRARRQRTPMDDLSDMMTGTTKAIIGVGVLGITVDALKEVKK